MKITLLSLFLSFALLHEAPIFAAPAKLKPNTGAKTILKESVSTYELHCHDQINQIRQDKGLHPLTWWPELSDCARGHSQNIANGHCPFGHDGFEQRMDHMNTLAKVYYFGENIAYCYNYENPVDISVKGWMQSEGHRKNILADFEETGIGVSISAEGKFYITQLFACRRQPK